MPIVADHRADFTGVTQPSDWRYALSTLVNRLTPASWTTMNVWNSPYWATAVTTFDGVVSADRMHPRNVGAGEVVISSWTSDVAGAATINLDMVDADSGGGDGVTVYLAGGTGATLSDLGTYSLTSNSGTLSVAVTLSVGYKVAAQVYKKATFNNDATVFNRFTVVTDGTPQRRRTAQASIRSTF